MTSIIASPGKADWMYDEELQIHIPCCSQHRRLDSGVTVKCGNGPLNADGIAAGDCGEDHVTPEYTAYGANEQADIVSWLRSDAGFDIICDNEGEDRMKVKEVEAIQNAIADAIERGEHRE